MPLRFAFSFLSSALDVGRSAFGVFLTTMSSSRHCSLPVTRRLASPLLTYHLSPSPPAPCSCAISSLNITEIDEQTYFGNGRDRHDRARCREATFGKGRIGARRGSR